MNYTNYDKIKQDLLQNHSDVGDMLDEMFIIGWSDAICEVAKNHVITNNEDDFGNTHAELDLDHLMNLTPFV